MIAIGQEIQWTNETDKKYKVFEAFSLCTIEALLFYAPLAGFCRAHPPKRRVSPWSRKVAQKKPLVIQPNNYKAEE